VTRRAAELVEALTAAPDRKAIEAGLVRLQTLRDALTFSGTQADERRTQWVQDKQEARTKREGLADQYRELGEQKERIVTAGPEGACPTCGRPLGKDFASMLGVLERQMEAVAQNGSFYRQRIEQLKDEPPELTVLELQVADLQRQLEESAAQNTRLLAALETAQAQRDEQKTLARRLKAVEKELAALPGAVYDEVRHRLVTTQLERLQPLALELERQGVVAARLAPLGTSLATLETAVREHTESVATIKAALKELGFSEERYQKLARQWNEVEAERQEAQLARVRDEADLQAARIAAEDVERRKVEREERQREVDAVSAELRLNTELDSALGDLRTELNATLRPDVSELASGFLRDLSGGRYTELELDEEYATTLVDDGEPKGVISGGEEDIANLSLRLAISQMIAERAGQPLSLLVLDEIFGSLDDDRRAAVLELLRGLADRFPQVILITHIDSVRDGFDRIIRVSYDPRRGVAMAEDEPVAGHDVAA
jgi:exonuclease SbcC